MRHTNQKFWSKRPILNKSLAVYKRYNQNWMKLCTNIAEILLYAYIKFHQNWTFRSKFLSSVSLLLAQPVFIQITLFPIGLMSILLILKNLIMQKLATSLNQKKCSDATKNMFSCMFVRKMSVDEPIIKSDNQTYLISYDCTMPRNRWKTHRDASMLERVLRR
jgi:hypothetical protein